MTFKDKFTALSQSLSLAQTVPVIVIGIYVAGFIALNAYLGKYGAFDMAILNSHYLTVGVLYFIFLAIWYFLPGRIIIPIDPDPFEDKECSLPYLIYRVLYLVCISSALFSIVLLGRAEPILFLAYAVIIAWVDHFLVNMWESPRFYNRFPLADRLYYMLFEPVTKIIGIAIFFLIIDLSSPAILVFVHFFLISVYIFLVLRSIEKFENTTERFAYTLTHSVVFLLLTSVAFGWLQHGHVKSVFGGGELRPLEIIVIDQTVSEGLQSMGFEVTPNLKANRVYENQEEIVVTVNDSTIRLNKNTIGGFRVLHSEVNTWATYLYKLINKIKENLFRVSSSE